MGNFEQQSSDASHASRASGCPVEIGDTVRFNPSAYCSGTAGLGMDLDVVVEATVIQIHEEHRWYRTEWRTAGGRILRESFKY